MSRSISILGCGWFGEALAKELIQNNYSVSGSFRSESRLKETKRNGLNSIQIEVGISSQQELVHFFETDSLIISYPIRVSSSEDLEKQLGWIQFFKSFPKQVILISSTSVYDTDGLVNETMPLTNSGRGFFQSKYEMGLQEIFGDKLTILRFAGLFGPNRNPGKFLAGKVQIPSPNAAVNLVHLDDTVKIARKIIETEYRSGIFNVCGDEHPTKKLFYTNAALILGLPAPKFVESNEEELSKIIDNSKSKKLLGLDYSITNREIQIITSN
ncbi:MAG: NAD(P)-binding domain-containing protein [Crocinitomicaceae bacterium]